MTRSRLVGMALLALLAPGLLSLVAACGRFGTPAPTAPGSSRSAGAAAGSAAAAGVGASAGVGGSAGDRPTGDPRQAAAVAGALRVLHEWDSRRAAAYAAGSTEQLDDLYLPGSGAGAADVHLLRRYRDRGLRVTHMRTQVLALAVLDRGSGRLRVRVTDRLVGAVARSATERIRLPRDTSSVRVLTLARSEGRWRMSGVVADRPATRARRSAGR